MALEIAAAVLLAAFVVWLGLNGARAALRRRADVAKAGAPLEPPGPGLVPGPDSAGVDVGPDAGG